MSAYRVDETTGFQSPAQDYIEGVVDLAAMLDLRRPNRYPVRVKGQALRDRGIHDGDILVADAAAEPKTGKVCVAMVGGDVILATFPRAGEKVVAAADQRSPMMCKSARSSGPAVDVRPYRRKQLLLHL